MDGNKAIDTFGRSDLTRAMSPIIQDILINTYNPDAGARKHAEAQLAHFMEHSGAYLEMLSFVATASNPRELRLSGAIVIKNKSREFWRMDEAHASTEEKEKSKALLLEVLLAETDNAIRGMLAETVRNIAEIDFPDKWPNLIPVLLHSIQSGDILKLFNALVALRKVVKRYEYKSK